MSFRSIGLLLLIGWSERNSMLSAAGAIHPRIPGYDRFYGVPLSKPAEEDDEPPVSFDPVTGGRILLGELNCTSCHSVGDNAKSLFSLKQAPILDDVGNRVKVDWLRSYLADPHAVKPGTTMPNVIAALPEESRGATIEALTHFLASTGKIVEGFHDVSAAKRGESLFQRVGCLACHNSMAEKSPDLVTSVILPDLGKKYSATSLSAFLKDPLKSRPSGRMPAMGLSDDDYRDIGHYFVRAGRTVPNVKYELYYGDWRKIPEFRELQPVKGGVSLGFDLSAAGQRNNSFGLRFTSFLQIKNADNYEFVIGSDDGSRLLIDDEMVADSDGIHPHQTISGRRELGIGFHKVIVEYFDGGGQKSLEVQIAGKNLPRQPLAGLLYLEPNVVEETLDKQAFVVDPQLVDRGRTLFAKVGCAACHSMTVNDQKIRSEFSTKPLAEVTMGVGCLAENVTGNAPRYGLSTVQRESLASVLKADSLESKQETAHRTLATLNCYACHQRDKTGGVELIRDGAFQSLQKEMGDEGRLPPTLTGVGDKLRPDWLRHVLHNSAEDRKNYMLAKMPKFGVSNVDPLVNLFVTIDAKPVSMPKADFGEPDYRVKAAGRHMVGGQSLSCIKCHDFGPHPSTGVRAISLTTMHRRLRADWFYRYVLDPQAYRRGTRMPAPWPFGQTSVRELLNADVNLQVQAVWMYLSDGEKTAIPSGLLREPIELKPTTEPIIYRNFIEGAGTRAIGVGYPEGVNLAFDANNMRLAMIWHGAFIDASRHWTGRGVGFETPLGDDILPLPNGVPLTDLDQPDREFPSDQGRELGYKFLGYHLDREKRPIFKYSLPGLTVEDYPIPVKGTGKFGMLQRTFQFEGAGASNALWYRAAVADKIELAEPRRYRIDGVWTMTIENSSSIEPVIREAAGKKELLVPIRLTNGKAKIVQGYIW